MQALLQRVSHANVKVTLETIGEINQGLLVFCGFEPHDTPSSITKLLDKIIGYRVFADDCGRMNLSVKKINGGLLLVPQFTIAADTSRGLRPSFSSALAPDRACQLFTLLYDSAKQRYPNVARGEFGADMQVSLCNDGPVTFLLSN